LPRKALANKVQEEARQERGLQKKRKENQPSNTNAQELLTKGGNGQHHPGQQRGDTVYNRKKRWVMKKDTSSKETGGGIPGSSGAHLPKVHSRNRQERGKGS